METQKVNLEEVESSAKRDFNNAICLMGVIPALIFAYLLTVRLSTVEVFQGEAGYLFLWGVIFLLMGIVVGKKLLWKVLERLFVFNQENIRLYEELMKKNRLATIAETTLTLSHELNNPLAITMGNLTLLEGEVAKGNVPEPVKEKLEIIKENCTRMAKVTDKLSNLSVPVSDKAYGDTTIIDLEKSK